MNNVIAIAVIKLLGKNFDSHAFIRKFMELYPKEYGEMLVNHENVASAHGEISSYLSKNARNLNIKKIGSIRTLNVFLRASSNALWSKILVSMRRILLPCNITLRFMQRQ